MKKTLGHIIRATLFIGILGGILIYSVYVKSTNNIKPEVVEPILDTLVASTPAFYEQNPEEGLREALEYYEIHHPDIVYAQAVLETGYFKSKLCIENNNIFGLYNSRTRSYWKFSHWTESVEAYKEWIQYRYKPPNDYYRFLMRIQYATDPEYISKLKKIVEEHDKTNKITSTSYNKQTTKRGT